MAFTAFVFNSHFPQKVSDTIWFPHLADKASPDGQHFCAAAGQIPCIICFDLRQTFLFKGESKTLFLPT